MAKDIQEQFKSEGRPFWWKIDTYPITAGLGVEVKGPNPALTEKIANFCIDNLDKINTELGITLNKPMVKVLDRATYGLAEGRDTLRKTFVAGIFSFLVFTLYIFFLDYLKRLKKI